MFLPPLRIPTQRKEMELVHDLNTRLGRAYERLCAFVEEERPEQMEVAMNELLFANAELGRLRDAEVMAEEGLVPNYEQKRASFAARRQELESRVVAAEIRLEDLKDITKALNRELNDAKRHDGQSVPPISMFACAKTLEQWDNELKTFS